MQHGKEATEKRARQTAEDAKGASNIYDDTQDGKKRGCSATRRGEVADAKRVADRPHFLPERRSTGTTENDKLVAYVHRGKDENGCTRACQVVVVTSLGVVVVLVLRAAASSFVGFFRWSGDFFPLVESFSSSYVF